MNFTVAILAFLALTAPALAQTLDSDQADVPRCIAYTLIALACAQQSHDAETAEFYSRRLERFAKAMTDAAMRSEVAVAFGEMREGGCEALDRDASPQCEQMGGHGQGMIWQDLKR